MLLIVESAANLHTHAEGCGGEGERVEWQAVLIFFRGGGGDSRMADGSDVLIHSIIIEIYTKNST